MPNDEEYGLPSAPRKKKEVELGKGVVLLPPERIKEEVKEEKEIKEEKKVVKEKPKITVKAPSARPGVLAVLAILFSIIAIAMGLLTLSSYSQMKTELREIVTDLKNFRDASIPITAEVEIAHIVKAEVSLKDVISPISIPVREELNVSGSVKSFDPIKEKWMDTPYEGTLTVSGSIDITPEILDPERKMSIDYTFPGKGEIVATIKGSDILTDEIENIIQRLERISG